MDSAGLTLGLSGKKGKEIPKAIAEIISNPTVRKSTENYLSVNMPNPFSSETVIQYAVAGTYHTAEIKVTTPLGQHIHTYYLLQNKGLIVIDGSKLQDGIYYYTLIVDGAVVSSKSMAVQK